MASRSTQISSEFLRMIASDIFVFTHLLGVEPTWQQWQALEAVQRGDKRIAIKSGQGPGKSMISAVIGLWRLLTPDHKLLLVAPTMAQAKTVWLAQCRKLVNSPKAHPALKKIYQFAATNIGVLGHRAEDWGAMLYTASTSSEKVQGQHAENMDVFFEEASGISHEIEEQYEGTMSNPNALFFKIGNPNTRSCKFFDCFNKDKRKWTHFTWNAEETPSSKWFSPLRNFELEEKYGRDSDVYRVRVLGEFPHSDPNCVLSMEDLQDCFDESRKLELFGTVNSKGMLDRQFGMDFARFGGDENVLFMRQGYAVRDWKFWAHVDPSTCVRHGFKLQSRAGWTNKDTLYVGDAGGIGQGVMHMFSDAGKQVHEFHTQHRASDYKTYDNAATEAAFRIKDLAKAGRLWLPEDSLLIDQLTTRVYNMTKKGKIILETKDEHKKRGFDSPDRADAFQMCFYDKTDLELQFAG
jgi:hypothetical protein